MYFDTEKNILTQFVNLFTSNNNKTPIYLYTYCTVTTVATECRFRHFLSKLGTFSDKKIDAMTVKVIDGYTVS